MASRSIEFESQERAHGLSGRDLLGAWKIATLKHLLPGELCQIGSKEKEPTKLSAELTWLQLQQVGIGYRGLVGVRMGQTFLVGPPGKAGEALFFEQDGNGDGTERVPLSFKRRLMS